MQMDTGIIIAIAGIVGALLSQIVSAYFSSQRDRQQWIQTQESQKNEWLRLRLLEIYSNCIEYLSKIPNANDYGADIDPITKKRIVHSYHMEIFDEAHKWLYMLLVFIPAGDEIEYRDRFEQVVSFSNLPLGKQQNEALSLRDKVLRLAVKDPRVK
jgi:hypothetical protein